MSKNTAPAVLIVAALTMVLVSPAVAQDEWQFGIGTGFIGLNLDGDLGFTTALGPVDLDASLDSDEIRELIESAFGLGGYAAKGKWVIRYSASQLELKDSLSGTGPLGVPASAGVTATLTGAEVSAAYRFALTGKHAWSVLGGIRYTKHEYDFALNIGGTPLARNIDQDWTDLIIGFTHGYQISEKWTWSNRLNAGFGGSEGTYFFNTSFDWQFAKSWALGLFGQITSVEFENDNRGDPDWYLYDADEFGLGVNILFKF